jgi:hypothetical protein
MFATNRITGHMSPRQPQDRHAAPAPIATRNGLSGTVLHGDNRAGRAVLR